MTAHYSIKWLTEKFESGNALEYLFFWGHSGKHKELLGKFCFSQWFKSPFLLNNAIYKTAEHWMMARKALLFDDKSTFDKIISCNKPEEAKELGRQVLGYDDQLWNNNKYEAVRLGNIHKFNQHPTLAEYLISTGKKILVEASPVDIVWGIGLAQGSKSINNIYAWRGQNLLGFALMEVRDFLREFGHFNPLDKSYQPPWAKFQHAAPLDMFWRMGEGEEYLDAFSKYYQSLTNREKTIYQLTNPQPYEWVGFYD